MIRRMLERLRARAPEETSELLERATRLSAKRRYLEAARVWREIAERTPRDGKPLLRMGECLEHAHRIGDALEAYRRAIHTFLRDGRRQAASAACRRVVELNPRDEVAVALLETLRVPEQRPNLSLVPASQASAPATPVVVRSRPPQASEPPPPPPVMTPSLARSFGRTVPTPVLGGVPRPDLFEDADPSPMPLPSELPPFRSVTRTGPPEPGPEPNGYPWNEPTRPLRRSRHAPAVALPRPLRGLPSGLNATGSRASSFVDDSARTTDKFETGEFRRDRAAVMSEGEPADPDELMPASVFDSLYGSRNAVPIDPEVTGPERVLPYEGDDDATVELAIEPVATDPNVVLLPAWKGA